MYSILDPQRLQFKLACFSIYEIRAFNEAYASYGFAVTNQVPPPAFWKDLPSQRPSVHLATNEALICGGKNVG